MKVQWKKKLKKSLQSLQSPNNSLVLSIIVCHLPYKHSTPFLIYSPDFPKSSNLFGSLKGENMIQRVWKSVLRNVLWPVCNNSGTHLVLQELNYAHDACSNSYGKAMIFGILRTHHAHGQPPWRSWHTYSNSQPIPFQCVSTFAFRHLKKWTT